MAKIQASPKLILGRHVNDSNHVGLSVYWIPRPYRM
jgi:hypothetical protein